MTGGRRGICGRPGGPADLPVYGGNGRGLGFRRGHGRGRGYGYGPGFAGYPYPQAYGTGSRYPASSTNEMDMLKAEAIQQSLDAIQRRITELEKEASA